MASFIQVTRADNNEIIMVNTLIIAFVTTEGGKTQIVFNDNYSSHTGITVKEDYAELYRWLTQ